MRNVYAETIGNMNSSDKHTHRVDNKEHHSPVKVESTSVVDDSNHTRPPATHCPGRAKSSNVKPSATNSQHLVLDPDARDDGLNLCVKREPVYDVEHCGVSSSSLNHKRMFVTTSAYNERTKSNSTTDNVCDRGELTPSQDQEVEDFPNLTKQRRQRKRGQADIVPCRGPDCKRAESSVDVLHTRTSGDSVLLRTSLELPSRASGQLSNNNPVNETAGRKACRVDKAHCCPMCKKTFLTPSKLRVHSRIHTGEKPFTCEECGMGFTQTGHMNAHKRIHNGDQPFICTECGKCFTLRSSLTRHVKLHAGVKPYQCVSCGKAFARPFELTTHMNIHTGETPLKCEYCGKGFRNYSSLSYHMNLHTGRNLYNCPMCNKSFSHRSHLTSHRKTHTDEKPFVCLLCHKGFRRSGGLKVHLRTHADTLKDQQEHFFNQEHVQYGGKTNISH